MPADPTPDSSPPQLTPDALRSFALAVRTVLAPAVIQAGRIVAEVVRQAITLATPAAAYLAGYQAGYEGRPSDWEMPDDWHRGYLRGRLAGLRERWRANQSVGLTATEITDTHS